MARYRFSTRMRFGAGVSEVHRAIVDPSGWLELWGDAVEVRRVDDGDERGVGRTFDATVRAPVGYRLSASIETVEVDGPAARPDGSWRSHLRMRSSGQLDGTGTWDLSGGTTATDVHFVWDVVTTARWMDLLTPIARPLFERSHGVVVRNASEAAAAHLGTDLLAFDSGPVRNEA
ncbi:MAG: hypothetical protein WEB03_00090 [Nitriliruptor sp.]|uniref:hypothetical protein n=1 Tax=Nitriliruptor sp. TaxID=2448056 RepID=UPI0034A064C3